MKSLKLGVTILSVVMVLAFVGCATTVTKTVTTGSPPTAYITTVTVAEGTRTITSVVTTASPPVTNTSILPVTSIVTTTLPPSTVVNTVTAIQTTTATVTPPPITTTKTITEPPTTIYATPANSASVAIASVIGVNSVGGITVSPVYISLQFTNRAPVSFSNVFLSFNFTTNVALANMELSNFGSTTNWNIVSNGGLSYTAKNVAAITIAASGQTQTALTLMLDISTLPTNPFLINTSISINP